MMFTDHELIALSADYPLGFYVCNLDRFDLNFREFLEAFQQHYSNTAIAYSYKTNYLPSLCLRADELGGLAEVVSGTEYKLAAHLGISGKRIVFNGPVKFPDELLLAARNGSVINVETEHEIELLEAIARDKPEQNWRLGLRCAVHLDPARASRFGFDVDAPSFRNVVRRLRAIPNVEFAGLHHHSIPPGRTSENYQRIARRLVAVGSDLWGDSGPAYIDLGGGFFSNMPEDFRRQFDVDIPTFDDYGRAITQPFVEAFGSVGGPQLILEPGLALVADAMSFVCRVLDCKSTPTRRLALAAGSVYNIRPTKSLRNLPLRHIAVEGAGGSRLAPPLDIVGYTCMEDDVLHRGYEYGLKPGDLLVFDNVGAYTLVLKPPFIQGNVPVLAYRKDARERVELKRGETEQDFLSSCEIRL